MSQAELPRKAINGAHKKSRNQEMVDHGRNLPVSGVPPGRRYPPSTGAFTGRSVSCRQHDNGDRRAFILGRRQVARLPSETQIPFEDPNTGRSFMFVENVNIGPYLFRKRSYLDLGGFDLAFSKPGSPGICFESELCYAPQLSSGNTHPEIEGLRPTNSGGTLPTRCGGCRRRRLAPIPRRAQAR
jgi:hypothetical protein